MAKQIHQITAVREIVLERTTVNKSSIHGPAHWDRVEQNAIYIAERNGADLTVVRLFAIFHDCMRQSDGSDCGHGPRAADFIRKIPKTLAFLSSKQVEKLCKACEGHTDKIKTGDATIGACWDADRLDLTRLGVDPRPDFLNTKPAIALAKTGSFDVLRAVRLSR